MDAEQLARPLAAALEGEDYGRVALQEHPGAKPVVVDGRDEGALGGDPGLLLDERREGDGLQGSPPDGAGALLETVGERSREGPDQGRENPAGPLGAGEEVRVGPEEALEARRPGRDPLEERRLCEEGAELALRREALPGHEAEDLLGREPLGNRDAVGDDAPLDEGPEDLLGRLRALEAVLAGLEALPAEEDPERRVGEVAAPHDPRPPESLEDRPRVPVVSGVGAGLDLLAPIGLFDQPLLFGVGLLGMSAGLHVEAAADWDFGPAGFQVPWICAGAEVTFLFGAVNLDLPVGIGLAARFDPTGTHRFDASSDLRPYVFLSFDSFRDAWAGLGTGRGATAFALPPGDLPPISRQEVFAKHARGEASAADVGIGETSSSIELTVPEEAMMPETAVPCPASSWALGPSMTLFGAQLRELE